MCRQVNQPVNEDHEGHVELEPQVKDWEAALVDAAKETATLIADRSSQPWKSTS